MLGHNYPRSFDLYGNFMHFTEISTEAAGGLWLHCFTSETRNPHVQGNEALYSYCGIPSKDQRDSAG